MSDFAFDARWAPAPAPRAARRNANLGSAEAEEIFMAFDTRIVRRFAAFLKPHPWYARRRRGGRDRLVRRPAGAMPLMIGQAVSVATSGRPRDVVGLAPRSTWSCVEFAPRSWSSPSTSICSRSG